VHRLQIVPSAGLALVLAAVTEKLGHEIEAVGGEASVEDGKLSKTGFALSYLDDEGDTVSITTDRDLLEAVTIARQGRRDKVDLFVHDPDKPPIPATLDPHPGLAKPLTPPESVLRERRHRAGSSTEEEEDENITFRRRGRGAVRQLQQEELIKGVPNELLLPGAVVTLAVVIIGVFAIGRMSSR
jgi:hypothetical protein